MTDEQYNFVTGWNLKKKKKKKADKRWVGLWGLMLEWKGALQIGSSLLFNHPGDSFYINEVCNM